jgi:predicted Rossmann fold nucleotide-binding protein DprA/Smf involved in DNA uptake
MRAEDILQTYGITSLSNNKSIAVPNKIVSLTLSVQEQILLFCAQPQSIDDIAKQIQKNLHEVQSILFEMQVAGNIEQDFMGLWKSLQ